MSSELDRLKLINETLLNALIQAKQELTFIVDECWSNNETHEGCEAAILEADKAIRLFEDEAAKQETIV